LFKQENWNKFDMAQTKILIVEDEAVIAQHLEDILTENDYNVIGVAHNLKKAISLIEMKSPDFVCLDIMLSDGSSGIDVAKKIRTDYKIPFIYLTSYSDLDTVKAVIATNPGGYLVKPFKDADIIPAIELAIANFSEGQAGDFPTLEMINKQNDFQLSDREYSIVLGIKDGKRNTEIAADNFISENTVKTHISRIYAKLNVNSKMACINVLTNKD